jgi:putative mRNA 3-end processing factor
VLFDDINTWWRRNADAGRASVLLCYAFGKAQRLLHGVDASIGPIVVHGAVEPLNAVYRAAGVRLPATHRVTEVDKAALQRALVLAPPSAQGTPWMKRFGADASVAFASGWMQVRGNAAGAGWTGVLSCPTTPTGRAAGAIGATGAEHIRVTHGSVPVLVRWLCERGLDAQAFQTEYGAEDGHRPGCGRLSPERWPKP